MDEIGNSHVCVLRYEVYCGKQSTIYGKYKHSHTEFPVQFRKALQQTDETEQATLAPFWRWLVNANHTFFWSYK